MKKKILYSTVAALMLFPVISMADETDDNKMKTMKEVVVTATRTSTTLEKIGGSSVTIISAEQGSWHAQRGLGIVYSEGKCVLQDYVIAYAWFNIAASQNIDVAKANRETLSKKMTPNQIEEGQKLSKELYDKIYNQTK